MYLVEGEEGLLGTAQHEVPGPQGDVGAGGQREGRVRL